jgi:ABC-type transport system involved in cytochrome bd biosynthesis fused ATPase/permease subunit
LFRPFERSTVLEDGPSGESLPLVLVALSGFVFALLSAFLLRTLGWVLVAATLLGALAAALVGRRRAGVLRALAVGAVRGRPPPGPRDVGGSRAL